MPSLVIAFVLSFSSIASAQISDLDTLRARASARGWSAHQTIQYARPLEVWCEALPCTGSRFELTVAAGGLSMVRVVLADAGDGFAMDASWQASGVFGFRFTRGAEVIDLVWDLGFEHPELAVHFSSSSERSVAAELALYLGSASELRHAALESRARLERNTERTLRTSATVREGTLAECLVERGTPEAHGIFDVCTHRMATDEERARVLASLRARSEAERTLIDAHFGAFSAAIRATLGPRSGP